jgi:hypothetical protein
MRLSLQAISQSDTFVLILGCLYSGFFLLFPENFKVMVAASILFLGLFFLVTRSLFTALFTMFLLSSFFYFPVKRYELQLTGPLPFAETKFQGGILAVFGLAISDIYALWIGFFLLRSRLHKNREKKPVVYLYRKPLVYLSIAAWLTYFTVSFISSLTRSFFPVFSVIVVLQSMKLLIMVAALIHLLGGPKKSFKFLVLPLKSLLLVQGVVSLLNFTNFDYHFLLKPDRPDIESGSLLLPRTMGIIGHGNQDALLTAVLLLLTLPFLLKKSSFTSKAILLLSGVTLVLYQSRTVWLGLVLSFLIYLGTFRKEARILGRLKKLKRRGIYYGLILILLLGTIVVPRLFLSRFFFSDEGGGALRIKMFKEGVELYSQSPWIGHGVQNVVLPLMKEFPEGYTLYFPVPVHLTPLELALESGLVGLVTFFVPFYLVLRKILLLAIKHQLSYELLSVFCSIVVIMIYFAIQPLDNLRRDFTLFGLVFGLSFIFLYRSEASHE